MIYPETLLIILAITQKVVFKRRDVFFIQKII
jgi:hypothetical protein